MIVRHKPRRATVTAGQLGQAAIIALLLIMGVGITVLVYNLATPAKLSIERDRITADALAQAKAALVGYAVSVELTGTRRLGDLPCPDIRNSGEAGGSCSNAGGTTLGRLPWKTLGLPDLRDGYGERLWYAVSSNFKNNPRTDCINPWDTGCLNSNTRGTITVRNKDGAVINDGSNPNAYRPSGVIAVIIAPGRVLQRQGTTSSQIRGCTVGVDCNANQECTASPLTSTPLCDPANYLDVQTGTEDNTSFTDGSATDGFLNGDVYDATSNLLVNDRIIAITYQDLMPLLEKRVVREAYNCLLGYSALSNGRYPWAANVANSAWGNYASTQGDRFGRIPESFSDTLRGLIPSSNSAAVNILNTACTALPLVPGCMSNSWPAAPACYISSTANWWTNWKDQVYYGVAEAYQPEVTVVIVPPSVTVPAPAACNAVALDYDCLAVNPPSSSDNKRFVVVVAGKRLSGVSGGQPRSTQANRETSANYLEDENGNNNATSNIYSQQTTSTAFNDVLLYLQ